jgi:hypothetical protein
MRFLIVRILTHSELGMFHEYRRQKKEGSKQRAVNFDWDVVDRVFPAAKDSDAIEMNLKYDTDEGVELKRHWLKRQEKNWRLEGNCPADKCYHFVDPGCLFVMEIEAGSIPATGSWAVFPADDPVARAILADGESSGLARSAMIALYDNEGQQTWRILSDARPDLFTMGKKGSDTTMTENSVVNAGVELAPNPARLVQILASVGHTMPSAVADIVDNAISADATEIAITFGRPDAGHGRWMSIIDNGNGMDRHSLSEAMRIGSNSDYAVNSLGKYGYGLKGASWSQAKVFTVVTKREHEASHHLTWDSADMAGWIAKSDPLEPWEHQATIINGHGTAILWKEMHPPHATPIVRGLDPYSAEVMELERHLALVFHRFVEGKAAGRKAVVLTINGKPVEPNNPFGHPLASAYDLKTIRVPTVAEDGKVQVQAYLLPSEEEISAHHKAEGAEAVRRALDLIGLHGKRNETQGLFIYRHDRLIKRGGWHQIWETNDEKTKLARIIVNFDKILDDAFKINISKQIVQLPQHLQSEIKKIADIARRDSQKKYRKVGMPIPAPPVTPPVGDTTGGTDPKPLPSPSPGALPVTVASLGQSAEAPPRIVVKQVKTDKFVWKVTRGMTGGLDVQVSELDASLSALIKRIGNDARAISNLATFLSALDDVDVQKYLLNKKAE